MAQHITSSGATVIAAQGRAMIIQVNKTLSGTITVTTAGSTQYGTSSGTVAVVTDPPVGTVLKYGGLKGQGAISVNPSATTDISVTMVNEIT